MRPDTNHAVSRYRCVVEALNGIDEILDLGNGFINTDFARYLQRLKKLLLIP